MVDRVVIIKASLSNLNLLSDAREEVGVVLWGRRGRGGAVVSWMVTGFTSFGVSLVGVEER